MIAYCLIGGTGEGKTSFARQLTNGKPCFIFDVNGEWQELPTDTTKPRSRYWGDHNTFVDKAAQKHGGTFIVFEEATGFLHGKTQEDMRRLLIGKRHPVELGGRNIIYLFHTIQSVPPFILDMANYIVLFKTGDDLGAVKKKRLKLVKPFLELQNAPKHSKKILKNV